MLVCPPTSLFGPVRETLNKVNIQLMRNDTRLKLTSAEGRSPIAETLFADDKHNIARIKIRFDRPVKSCVMSCSKGTLAFLT